MLATWLDSGETLHTAQLASEGVYYAKLPTSGESCEAALAALRHERGYSDQDVVELSDQTPGLAAICHKFLAEHLHDEDEVRFVLHGEGVFDIRSTDDRWMRVAVTTGDLIVVPAQRYHRFMLTEANTIRCLRLFQNKEGWHPFYRSEALEIPTVTAAAASVA